MNEDGDTITVTKRADGSTVSECTNGTTTTTQPDGSSHSENIPLGGAPVIVDREPDGTTTTQFPNGSNMTTYPDGSQSMVADGSTITTYPDGTVTWGELDGQTMTGITMEQAIKEGYVTDPTIISTGHNTGTVAVIELQSNGTIPFVYVPGSLLVPDDTGVNQVLFTYPTIIDTSLEGTCQGDLPGCCHHDPNLPPADAGDISVILEPPKPGDLTQYVNPIVEGVVGSAVVPQDLVGNPQDTVQVMNQVTTWLLNGSTSDEIIPWLVPRLPQSWSEDDKVDKATDICGWGERLVEKTKNVGKQQNDGPIEMPTLPQSEVFAPQQPQAPAHPTTYSPPAKEGEKTMNDPEPVTVGERDLAAEQADLQGMKELAAETLATENGSGFYQAPVSIANEAVGADGELKYKPEPPILLDMHPLKDDPFVWMFLDQLWQDFASGDARDRLPEFFKAIPTGVKKGAEGLVNSLHTAIDGWSKMTADQLASLPDATKAAMEDVKKAAKDLNDLALEPDGGKKFAKKVGELTGDAMFQATLGKVVEAGIGKLAPGAGGGVKVAEAEAKAGSKGAKAAAGALDDTVVDAGKTVKSAEGAAKPVGAETGPQPKGMDAKPLSEVPVDPNEAPGTKLPYKDYLDDPLDPLIDPITEKPIVEPGPLVGDETTILTPEQKGITGPAKPNPKAPDPPPKGMDAKGMKDVPVDPNENWGTKLPYDDAYLDDPLDPLIDPITEKPIPDPD